MWGKYIMRRNCAKRRTLVGMCLAAVVLLGGCGEASPEQESHVAVENANDKIEYSYLTAEIGDVVVTRSINCTYRQQKEQELSFGITGRQGMKFYVNEGEHVKKGTLLAELAVTSLEEQVEDLEYSIARNELLLKHIELNEALDRSQSWVDYIYNHFMDEERNQKNLESIEESYRYQREDCEDALEVDRVELARVKRELAYSRIYAGMDGMVYKINKNHTSKAGETVITIVDDSQCLFEMEDPEYADYFPEGEPVAMKISSGMAAGEYELLPYDREHWGKVQQFSVLSGPVTTGIEMGTRGTIQLVTESRTQVLCVPKAAIHSADEKYYVYVTDKDNMRQIRWVEVGLIGDTSVEILSGLEAGERVVRK